MHLQGHTHIQIVVWQYLIRRQNKTYLLLNHSSSSHACNMIFFMIALFLPLCFDTFFPVSLGFVGTGFVSLNVAFVECFWVTFVFLFLTDIKVMLTFKITAFPCENNSILLLF